MRPFTPPIVEAPPTAPVRWTILLVDDDRLFRRALADTLRDDGYHVFDYDDPRHVPPLLAFDVIAALIIGYRMLSREGVTFADHFRVGYPDASVILMSTYTTPRLESEVAVRPYIRLLSKPLDYRALLELLPPMPTAAK